MTRTIVLAAAAAAAVAGAVLYFQAERARSVPVDLRIPIYPGARFQDRVASGSTELALLESDDPPAAVVTFYRQKLPGRVRVLQTSSGTVIHVDAGGAPRILTVTSEGGKTRIAVAVRERR